MKVIAMHLPQFHAIAENDEWWGEGFTEWTNIKRENKFCNGLKPLDDNYYNLLDKKTMQWQCDLSQEYGIYGFCYYQYYFESKMLLEKPVENLLRWKDINQKFCFCWANHSWRRVWDGNPTILQEQTYGGEESWQAHFDYLKDFFLDERYIKIDNKPIFMVFNNVFTEKTGIIGYFDKRAKECGFDGIYFVESINDATQVKNVSGNSTATVIREPNFTVNYLQKRINFLPTKVFNKAKRLMNRALHIKMLVTNYNGNRLMKSSIRAYKQLPSGMKFMFCAYSMWDNTYRHNQRGYKITKPTEKAYLRYLTFIKECSEHVGNEYMFFNAWNEWAEGMILEPDQQNGYFFLEGIKKIFKE